jgi:transcriptional regulator with XRE-family HTH domain
MDLQTFLDSRRLTDAEFAATIGRDRTTVSRWRRRLKNPSAEALRRIAEATGGEVTPNDFFAGGSSPGDDKGAS